MDEHIRPRTGVCGGDARGDPPLKKSGTEWHPSRKTKQKKQTFNGQQLADSRAVVKRPATFCFKTKPLSSLGNALPPELWSSIRWQAETEAR